MSDISLIDFSELRDGDRLEDLMQMIFKIRGVFVERTGVGQDKGKDIVIEEKAEGFLKPLSRRWLVQCKYRTSESVKDLGAHPNTLIERHRTKGYLLVTTTQPSTTIKDDIESLNNENEKFGLCWNRPELEYQILQLPEIFKQFFPKSYQKYTATWPSNRSDLIGLFPETEAKFDKPFQAANGFYTYHTRDFNGSVLKKNDQIKIKNDMPIEFRLGFPIIHLGSKKEHMRVELRASGGFAFHVFILYKFGNTYRNAYLNYKSRSGNPQIVKLEHEYFEYPLGTECINNQWLLIERDLSNDLFNLQNNGKLIAINDFKIAVQDTMEIRKLEIF